MARLARALRPLGGLVLVALLAWAHGARIAEVPYAPFANPRFPWVAGFAALLVATGYATGLPDEPRSRLAVVLRSLSASGVALLGISAAQLLLGEPLMPRFVALGAPIILIPLDLLVWNLCGDANARTTSRTRALVVGEPAEVALLREELLGGVERRAQVVADMTTAAGRPRRPEDQPLIDAAVAGQVNLVVLDRSAQADDAVVAQVAKLHANGVSVRTLSMFYSEYLGKLPVSELQRVSLLFDVGELHRGAYPRCKRVIDVVVACLGVLVLVPLIPVVWLANLAGNRGPLWFRQVRVGAGGRPVTLLKFRTMSVPSPEDEGVSEPVRHVDERDRSLASGADPWTAADDARVTRFGRWMRATHLDELPQVLGVLRGELSLVGPRPEQPAYVAELSDKLPFYEVRLLVRPGLTGWAQVKYGYAADTEDAREKLQYDIYYLRHQSLTLDLRILGRTVRHVVSRAGR